MKTSELLNLSLIASQYLSVRFPLGTHPSCKLDCLTSLSSLPSLALNYSNREDGKTEGKAHKVYTKTKNDSISIILL